MCKWRITTVSPPCSGDCRALNVTVSGNVGKRMKIIKNFCFLLLCWGYSASEALFVDAAPIVRTVPSSSINSRSWKLDFILKFLLGELQPAPVLQRSSPCGPSDILSTINPSLAWTLSSRWRKTLSAVLDSCSSSNSSRASISSSRPRSTTAMWLRRL